MVVAFICSFSSPTVPGAPPRRVDVDVLNSTALKVMWRSLAPGKQHGQIRGYQVHYVRVENGESRGLPLIKDVMLADAQVRPRPLTALSLSPCWSTAERDVH